MRIDIISDVVCPWCFIAKRRLEKVLSMRPTIKPEIKWRPFQLNPNMPDHGRDFFEYYTEKFGGEQQAKSMINRIRAAGFEEGIQLHHELIQKSPNTLNAHTLVRWANEAQLAGEAVEAIFQAYFVEGRDIGNIEVLMDIGIELGLDGEKIFEDLYEGISSAYVKSEVKAARQMGIEEVPTLIFNKKYMMTGISEPFDLLQMIDRVHAEERAQAAPAMVASSSASSVQP